VEREAFVDWDGLRFVSSYTVAGAVGEEVGDDGAWGGSGGCGGEGGEGDEEEGEEVGSHFEERGRMTMVGDKRMEVPLNGRSWGRT